MHLAQELLTNVQCSGGSISFAEHSRGLKMRSAMARKLTITNWEPSSKLILLHLHKKLPKSSVSTILQSLGIWSKLERWKSSIRGCLMGWPQIKILSFWSVVFSYFMQQQWTISWSHCDVRQKVNFIWQLAMTRSVLGLRKSSKALPKAEFALKSHGRCLVVCYPSYSL